MSNDLRNRARIPFQGFKEVTLPPQAVCGFGSTPAYQYELPNDPTKPHVDPIQVGPTG